jgi:tetratricopeptide (TPR) repeat protein
MTLRPKQSLLFFSVIYLVSTSTWAETTTIPQSVGSAAEVTADPCFEESLEESFEQPVADFRTVERACSDTIAALESLISSTDSEQQTLVGAYNNRAIARTRIGELDLAAEDLGRAMVLAPESWPTYLNRGNLMIAMGQPQAALADFRTAQALTDIPLPATLRNATLAFRALSDIKSAEASLRASIEADSGLRLRAPDTGVPPGDPPR